jgi:hypothetical protein
MIFNIGDKVSVLDDAVDGVVTAIKGLMVVVETTEGFIMNYEPKELIKINDSTSMDESVRRANFNEIKREKAIPKPRSFVKEKKNKNEGPVPEFDLHIEKLVKSKHGMSNYDILTIQTDTAKRHIEFAITNRIPKIVFIHGVGEGVLKSELDFLLGRYENIDFHEANYQKYGQGATEVYIKQRKV